MQWGNWSYKPVDHVDNSDPEADADIDIIDMDEKDTTTTTTRAQAAGRSSSSRRATTSIIPLAATLTAVLFFVLFLFTPRPWLASDHPARVRHYGCGNSTADASAAGCRFDVMSYTWVHPRCFDQELMYDFLGAADWAWYADEDAAQPLPLADVAQGQREYVYVTWRYYTTHCTYMWKKMHRSTMTSRSLDSYVSDYRHTEKCEKVLLDRERDLDSASVMLVAKYPSCPVVSK